MEELQTQTSICDPLPWQCQADVTGSSLHATYSSPLVLDFQLAIRLNY